MWYVWIFLLIPIAAFSIFPFSSLKLRGIVTYMALTGMVVLTSIVALNALLSTPFELLLQGSYISGDIRLKVDALSAWFILVINFGFLTGGFYGLQYLKAYSEQKKNVTMHAVLVILIYSALIGLCAIQNGFVFLIAWEIMALSAFLAVIFEHQKADTIKAGINYLIQSHVSILFLMIGFIWVSSQTGSYDFNAIRSYSDSHTGVYSLLLFLFFSIGFAIKAGFVPFHTWLPHAHPVAPSHISGLMSGILIKIGIFGILRMLLLIKVDFVIVGTFLIIVSVVTGLYGVMLAILQHNLKKLLAYHSIENIGIIGLGIGIGCLGLGNQNMAFATLGFAGALLHVLNHSLFKAVLFYGAGNVYLSTHNLDIEKMGGLMKKMPQTAILFLIAALAITGLPPFNGFVSEFLLYSALFNAIPTASVSGLMVVVISITALVLIGGLALICFTKVFGVVFLGSPRFEYKHEVKERSFLTLLPMYTIVLLMLLIGLFPVFFIHLLIEPVGLFTSLVALPAADGFGMLHTDVLRSFSVANFALYGVIGIGLFVRYLLKRRQTSAILSTWGCGYTAPTAKMQYTASSFVKSYAILFKMFFLIHQKEKPLQGIFPTKASLETHPSDYFEETLIDYPTNGLQHFLNRFTFIQNGNLQTYILYGILFIVSVLLIPLIYNHIDLIITFIKQI